MRTNLYKLGCVLAAYICLASIAAKALEVCKITKQTYGDKTVFKGELHIENTHEKGKKYYDPTLQHICGDNSWFEMSVKKTKGPHNDAVSIECVAKGDTYEEIAQIAEPAKYTIEIQIGILNEKEEVIAVYAVNHKFVVMLEGPQTIELTEFDKDYGGFLWGFNGELHGSCGCFSFQKDMEPMEPIQEKLKASNVICAEIKIEQCFIGNSELTLDQIDETMKKYDLSLSAKSGPYSQNSLGYFDYCFKFDSSSENDETAVKETVLRLYITNVVETACYNIRMYFEPKNKETQELLEELLNDYISVKYSIKLRRVVPFILIPDLQRADERKLKFEERMNLNSVAANKRFEKHKLWPGLYHEFDVIRSFLPFVQEWNPVYAYEYCDDSFVENEHHKIGSFAELYNYIYQEQDNNYMKHKPVVLAFGCGGLGLIDYFEQNESNKKYKDKLGGTIFLGVPFYGIDLVSYLDTQKIKNRKGKVSFVNGIRSYNRLERFSRIFGRGSEHNWRRKKTYNSSWFREYVSDPEKVQVFFGAKDSSIYEKHLIFKDQITSMYNTEGFIVSTGVGAFCAVVSELTDNVIATVLGVALPALISYGCGKTAEKIAERNYVLACDLSTRGDNFVSAFSANLMLNLGKKANPELYEDHEDLLNIPFNNYDNTPWDKLHETLKSFSE